MIIEFGQRLNDGSWNHTSNKNGSSGKGKAKATTEIKLILSLSLIMAAVRVLQGRGLVLRIDLRDDGGDAEAGNFGHGLKRWLLRRARLSTRLKFSLNVLGHEQSEPQKVRIN